MELKLLVLACTHYPLIKAEIEKYYAPAEIKSRDN